MKTKAIVGALFALLLSALPAQIVGHRYDCCNSPQGDLLQFGMPSISTPGGAFLTTITPIHTTVASFLMISTAEDSNPWPLDPAAGWLLVNPGAAHYVGTVDMTVSTSGVEWIYRFDIPPGVPASEIIFVQCVKLTPSLDWFLTDGWTTPLQL